MPRRKPAPRTDSDGSFNKLKLQGISFTTSGSRRLQCYNSRCPVRERYELSETKTAVKLWVGTSGYSYKAWLGSFYPERLAAKEMLPYYASRLPAVEINNTFYRLPKASVLHTWAEQVPADFRFVLKAPQRITHQKRLKDSASEVEYLFNVATELGAHTGAVLFQLPPYLRKSLSTLESFLSLLPADRAVAFEFRHASWFDDEVFQCLRAHNRALCLAEMDDTENTTLISTATWGYVRLRRSEYSRADLLDWKERILSQPWEHAYVFFKHEDEGIGPRLAKEFLELNSN